VTSWYTGGFVPLDCAWWPETATALTAAGNPWPRALMLFDLRWWADQERMTDGRIRRPGRPTLVERWNVTQHEATKILKAESEWTDTWTQDDPTADRQRTDSGPTADRQRANGSGSTIDEKPTADQQQADSSPTESRPTRVGSTDTDTFTDRTPVDAGASTTGQASEEGKVLELVAARDARSAVEREAVTAVYAHWHDDYHPTAAPVPTEDHAALIRDRLRDLARSSDVPTAQADLCALVDCFHTGPDTAHWRGANDRKRQGRAAKYLGIASLFKREKFGDRLALTREWLEAGRPEAEELGTEAFVGEADNAWKWVLGNAHGPRPPLTARSPEGHAKERALEAGLQACGGWSAIGRSTSRDDAGNREAFQAAYIAARAVPIDEKKPAAKHRRDHA
jgi:hypothetical protein